MSAREEAIDALADTLDALDEHLRRSEGVARRSERNRLNMLHVHAMYAMAVGPLFALVGHDGMRGPTWIILRTLPGAPYSLGALLWIGGLTLAVATMRRAVKWEMVGLWIVLGWYATVSVSFGLAVFLWLSEGAPGGAAKPSPYGPVVYLHFVTIMAVHIRTLLRIQRRQRADP